MCTVCGLPTSHANTAQTLGLLTLLFGSLTAYTGAWLVVSSARIQRWLQKFSIRKQKR
jgi:hypothetical protein